MSSSIPLRAIALLTLVFIGTGCASQHVDPYETLNRKVFSFNDSVDRYALRPATRAYQAITPAVVERGIGRFFRNLNDPFVSLNQLAQGKPRKAGEDLIRFLVNSTVGVGGFFDPASAWGLEKHDEDFGQTLATWGWRSNTPYLIVPFFGPSSLRDASGSIVGVFAAPPRYITNVPLRNSILGTSVLNQRSELMENEDLIFDGDRYAFIRDAYLQNREFLSTDGETEVNFDF